MPVTSARELARSFEQEVAKPATLRRRWVCVLSDNTLSGSPITETDILTATTGTSFGVTHPTLNAWKLRRVTINEGYEGSPYHVEVIGEYSIVRDEELQSPTSRDPVWNFEATQSEVPALYYYSGSGNSTTYPLTNSAYDYFPGLMTQESVVRMTVQKNFTNVPTSWFQANNHVNDATYLGCAAHSIRVSGISCTYNYEEFGAAIIKYWSATATLVYRQSGHDLQLPDIGWNYLDSGTRRRAMVFDFQNAEWVASANPVGLDGYGNQTLGNPAILVRRVNPETNYQTLFGTPPS
jgi:hypothetical protein